MRELQFKLLEKSFATNDFLHKIGLKPIDSCTFCGETIQNLIHLFWKYKHARTDILKRNSSVDMSKPQKLKTSEVLRLGIVNDIGDLRLHHALFIARYYKHTCWLRHTPSQVTNMYKKSPELDGN